MDGCMSVLVRLFFNWSVSIYSKIQNFFKTFYSQQSLYNGVHLLQFLNAVICSLITTFFKCIVLHQILPQFSTIMLTQVLEIIIFGKDYSNLREQGQHLLQQKRRILLALHFLKKYPTQNFFSLVPKNSFAPKGTFSIKLIGV